MVTNSLRGSKINPTWSSQFVLVVDVSLSTVVSAPASQSVDPGSNLGTVYPIRLLEWVDGDAGS